VNTGIGVAMDDAILDEIGRAGDGNAVVGGKSLFKAAQMIIPMPSAPPVVPVLSMIGRSPGYAHTRIERFVTPVLLKPISLAWI